MNGAWFSSSSIFRSASVGASLSPSCLSSLACTTAEGGLRGAAGSEEAEAEELEPLLPDPKKLLNLEEDDFVDSVSEPRDTPLPEKALKEEG